jgi:transcriptional regulator with XRE-family HTH domain
MVYRQRLGSEVRKAREAAGFSQRDVAKAMDWSLSKLLRIENGTASITSNDLRVLLAYYQVRESTRERLIEVARAGRNRQSRETEADRAVVPVDVYLDTDDDETAERVFAAVERLLEVTGYDRSADEEVVRGSIWRRAITRLASGVTANEVRAQLAKAERAIELAEIDGRQADVDMKEASAVAELLDSLADVPQACIRVGALLLIKYTEPTGAIGLSRTLSQAEIRAIERFPEIQTKPREVLGALASAVSIDEQHHASDEWHIDPPPG